MRQRRAQVDDQAFEHLTRRRVVVFVQLADSLQRVEKELWLDLGLQHLQIRFQCFLLQFHLSQLGVVQCDGEFPIAPAFKVNERHAAAIEHGPGHDEVETSAARL